MPPFAQFAENSEIVRALQRYGKRVAPLQLIGSFLTFAGNIMLKDIYDRFSRKIFYGNSKAKKIVQQEDGTWITEVEWQSNQMAQVLQFRSKNIVLACGAN